jgi:hypothetical protein
VTQQCLDAVSIELGQVLEGEHERPDAIGGFLVALLQQLQEAGLGRAVEQIENLGHDLVIVAAVAAREVGHELRAQGALDVAQHVFLHELHAQHAHDRLDRRLLGQAGQDPRGVLGADARQDQSDGLVSNA